MPSRPRPLSNLTSSRSYPSDYRSLTPRTPHSRSGRAEEGFTEIELSENHEGFADDEYEPVGQQQAAPLLASSSSAQFAYAAGGSKKDKAVSFRPAMLVTGLARLPLAMGMFVAGVLFILIVFSFKRPEALHKWVGATIPKNKPTIISQPSSPETAIPSLDTSSPITHVEADPNILSYENYTNFPLRASEYRQECRKLNVGYMSHGKYWDTPKMGALDVVHHDDTRDYKLPEGEMTTVCRSSITYMLDGEVGLAADLALMAQAAALARERNRTFLIDDTYWNRGRWIDHFQDVRARQPGPEPGCRAPPPEELVACPRTARHWVINSRTAKYHFGHAFADNYEDAYSHNLNRLKPIYNFAAESFSTTIRPNAENAELIRLAREELFKLMDGDGDSDYVAVHLRRGDRKPASYEYHDKHIPLSEFSDAVTDTWSDESGDPFVYIASDSPAAEGKFSSIYEGSTYSLFRSKNPRLAELASPGDYQQQQFNEYELSVRVSATRGMIIDLALISGMWAWKGDPIPDGTVCTISSNVCKLAAVGLEWNRAFGRVDQMGYVDESGKGWVEIDQKDRVVPVWRAFELF